MTFFGIFLKFCRIFIILLPHLLDIFQNVFQMLPEFIQENFKKLYKLSFFQKFQKKTKFRYFSKICEKSCFCCQKKKITQNFNIFLKFSNFGMNSAKFWKNIEFLFYFLNYGKRGKMDAKREEIFFSLET